MASQTRRNSFEILVEISVFNLMVFFDCWI